MNRPGLVSMRLLIYVAGGLLASCGDSSALVQDQKASTTTEAALPEHRVDPPGSSQRSAAAAGAVVFMEHRVTDPGMENMLIATLLVPEGWKVEGGATRPSSMLYNMPVIIDVWITAPDGRTVRFHPSLSFEFNHRSPGKNLQPTQGGSLYYPLPDSPGQWMVEVALANPAEGVSRVRLVSEEDLPEITEALRQQNAQRFQSVAQLNQTTAQMGFGTEFDTQATRVVLQYEKDGRRIEATTVLTWQYEVMVERGRVTQGTWNIMRMQSLGGPVGSEPIDDPVLNAIVQSVRNNPVWAAEMNKYWMELGRIRHQGNMNAIKSAARISQIQAEGANAVNDIIMKGWRATSASSDSLQTRTVDSILEQTGYQSPSGEPIKLPSFYDHVLTNGNGRYILHNDAFYDPNLDPLLDGEWQEVEEQR